MTTATTVAHSTRRDNSINYSLSGEHDASSALNATTACAPEADVGGDDVKKFKSLAVEGRLDSCRVVVVEEYFNMVIEVFAQVCADECVVCCNIYAKRRPKDFDDDGSGDGGEYNVTGG